MGVDLLVAVGVRMVLGGPAESGKAPDHRLVDGPPEGSGPHEGLVVETGGEESLEQGDGRADIEIEGRPPVLAPGIEAVIERDLRRPDIGLGPPAPSETDKRVRLLGTRGENPSRAVVLETPPDDIDPVREQRGGQGIALEAPVRPAVEREVDRHGPIDQPAGLKPHGGGHRSRPSRYHRLPLPVRAVLAAASALDFRRQLALWAATAGLALGASPIG